MSNEFHDENNLYHFSYRDPNAESHAESAAGSTVEPAAYENHKLNFAIYLCLPA